jgi:DMSO/TMAO reductase YedYZ molybdopterin-dependent catalytic subunit
MTDDHAMFQQQLRHVPKLDKTNWLLIVDGFVTKPLTLNYNTLTQRPSINLNAALMCAGHTPEKHMLADANWEGIPLSGILATVQPTPQAQHIAFHSADGYATSLPLDEAENITLIHTMNGKPLLVEHGFPVRVLVTGLAGYKQPKWVTHITLTDSPVKGFWERRGLPSDGVVNPIVTITGKSMVKSIQLRIDSASPMQVKFTKNTENRISQWQTTWIPSVQGHFLVEADIMAHDNSRGTTSVLIEVTA